MIIGIFGLCIRFLPLYKLDIRPWIYILSKQTQPVTLSQKEYMVPMHNLWNPQDQRLLERLNKYFFNRTYFSKNRLIQKVIHQDILVQGCDVSVPSAIIYMRGGKKLGITSKGRRKVLILQVPRSNASTTNLFHLKINGVATGKFKTWFCRRDGYSKLVHTKLQVLFVGIGVHGTFILQWTANIL